MFLLVGASIASNTNEDMFKFMKFIQMNNKQYENIEEFEKRFEIFKINLHKVSNHEEFNQFMDMTSEEFK